MSTTYKVAQEILDGISSDGLTIDKLPVSGHPNNLRWLARQTIVALDSAASTSWVAFADETTLRRYLIEGIAPAAAPKAPLKKVERPTGTTSPWAGVLTSAGVSASAAHSSIDEEKVRKIVREEHSKLPIYASTAATSDPHPDIEALKARVDTVAGSVLEAIDTAKAVADEAARKASEAARAAATVTASAVTAATGIDESKVKAMINEAVRAATVAKPDLPTPTKGKAKDNSDVVLPDLKGDKSSSAIPDSKTDHVMEHLELFCAPGRSTKPVLVKGEAGAGKTYAARVQGRSFEAAFEIALNAQTEAADLLGFPRVDGGWQDGPLTAAFRSAAAGFTTQLRLDEFYRPTNQARSVLLTCTSPFEDAKGNAFYVLTTGRAEPHPTEEGVYQQETLYAPCHLLAIVATTNVGAQYDVSAGDPAEKRRFAPVHVDVTETVIRRILKNAFPKATPAVRKIESGVTEALVDFWKQCKELTKTAMIEIPPTVSTFVEAITHPQAKDKAAVQKILLALGLHIWCGENLTGEPIAEQVSAVTKCLKAAFDRHC